MSNISIVPEKKKSKSPSFFGLNPPTPTLAKTYPVHWQLYVDEFIDLCDKRFLNLKVGTGPFFRKKTSGGKDLPLKAFPTYLEQHLDPEHHNLRRSRKGKGPLSDCIVLGVYGGRYTTHVLADLDNHDSLGKTFEAGMLLKIADLDLPYLSMVKRAYDLPRKPSVIVTSSRSLGLYSTTRLNGNRPTGLIDGLRRVMKKLGCPK